MALLASISFALLCSGCDWGFLSTGGTNDHRKLIGIAYYRMYKQNRVVGTRNVLRRAIALSGKKGDLWALCTSYNMMAFTYIVKDKNLDRVESYYRRAVKIAEENNFDCELIHSYIGLALSSKLRGDTDQALSYEAKAEALLKKAKHNFENRIQEYEGGQKAIDLVEERFKTLHPVLVGEVELPY